MKREADKEAETPTLAERWRTRPPFSVRLWLRIKSRAPKSHIIYTTITDFLHNDLPTSAAAIAYFGMLVLFPALLLLSVYYQEGLLWIRPYFPGSYDFVRHNLEAMKDASTGIQITCITVLLWAGSWIFNITERTICRIWNTEPRKFLHGRLLTISMMTGIGTLLLASFLLTSGLSAFVAIAERSPRARLLLAQTFTSAVLPATLATLSLLLTILMFALIYRFMPNTKVKMIEALPGAIIAGVLWEAVKYAFAWVLPYFHYDLLYGSIGAGVALLTWTYISSSIMFFGAQLSAVLHCQHQKQTQEQKEEC
ncbi:MAG TPA: YihY/virulence factor BrkB family protein [Blastocatellia bacterium]|nr:YihY/virulence factor BrkB family protein [Blastocatellia bacterium]HMX28460.1 YihY/virulence factor BrkB family protein [Blastocatellia bacterium]HNG34146.1 YihY/virulence factor BrkB family protein [Blastocatellia bacterium]